MGYILPVDQHQYNQYHLRVSGETKSPYIIERPFRVELETRRKQSYEYREERLRMSRRYRKQNHNHPKNAKQAETLQLYTRESVRKKPNEKYLAEITGKGQYFSENI
ncbi:hypothetical protein [Alkalibacillus silvisoli]|uniref:Transposase n=1 Tax=Alkalibacillus silvisoli TaxID=392823 RepID=A0ABP3JLR0_9BACI